MRDYKVYLPHHRDFGSDPLDMEGRESNPIAFVALVVLCGFFSLLLVWGLDREAAIDQAIAQARKIERERIYAAASDLLAGHEQYRKQLDHQIDLAYRQGR